MDNDLSLSEENYKEFLLSLKERIRSAQVRSSMSVNRELVLLYWQIGRDLAAEQTQEGWGSRMIERLARDLHASFPGVQGFSDRNLWRMRAFYLAYPVDEFLPQPVAEIPWGHNMMLLEKVEDPEERLWYAQMNLELGWSRNVLAHQVESGLFERQGKAVTNFSRSLPAPQSDLAQQILKDPYPFDFLTLGTDAKERDLERGLLDHIRQFLLELGVGFAFVGSQYHLEVGGEDFYPDLLFYHLRLRCYVVIDLKVGEFRPEDAGKMNFYLSAVDDLLRHREDPPSIGIVLCRTRSRMIAEYALRDLNKPVGVSEYRWTEALPEDFKGSLPTIEELEVELLNPKETEEESIDG